MIRIQGIFNFNHRKCTVRIIYIRQIPRQIVSEYKFHLVGSKDVPERRGTGKRNHAAASRLAIGIHPQGIRNCTKSQAKAHIVCTGRRRHRIHVTTAKERNRFGGSPVAAALHDALAEASAIGSPHIVRNSRIAEIAEPVIHPFHCVSDHVANLGTRRHRANRMQVIIRIISRPCGLRIPEALCHKGPFCFCRQAVSLDFGVEGKAFQVYAMIFRIQFNFTVGIRRIKALFFTASISKENGIVIRQIRRRKSILFARDRNLRRLHQRIEFSASHLGLADRKIVIQNHLHLRAFASLGKTFIGTKHHFFFVMLDRHHVV